jgi:hypothetical protein
MKELLAAICLSSVRRVPDVCGIVTSGEAAACIIPDAETAFERTYGDLCCLYVVEHFHGASGCFAKSSCAAFD